MDFRTGRRRALEAGPAGCAEDEARLCRAAPPDGRRAMARFPL